MQNAQAARGGLLAAQLAARNVTGASTAREGTKGFLRSYAGIAELPESWTQPLKPEAILAIYAKPWATSGDNMAAVRAAKLIRDDGIDTSKIVSLQIKILRAFAKYPGTSFKGPFILPVHALASTGFATAAMLLFGDLEYEVSLEQSENPTLLALVQKSTVVPNDSGTKLDAQLTAVMSDQSVRVRQAADAPRTWLYHDPDTSITIFEKRMSASGFDANASRDFATGLFEVHARIQSIKHLLDRCTARTVF